MKRTEINRIMWAYVMDRAAQYDESSGIYEALNKVAHKLLRGEAWESFDHGELDDLLARM